MQERRPGQLDDATLQRIAYAIGNELRNPLAAIRAAHDYLARRLAGTPLADGDPRVAEALSGLDEELHAALRVLDDLRDLAADKPPTRTTFALRPLAAEAIAGWAGARAAACENDVPASLPAVALDRARLERALGHLVRNAVEALPDTRAGRVRIGAAIDAGVLRLSVADEGIGASTEDLARAREPLFGTKAKGAGLGLAIVERFAVAHGGTLESTSELGRGSTFTLVIPHAVRA